jgi:hypothetical protein
MPPPAPTKSEQTYLRGQYRRLLTRCGRQKAAVSVGHTILRMVYHLLKYETPWHRPRAVPPPRMKSPSCGLHSKWMARVRKGGTPWCHEPADETAPRGRRHLRLWPARGAHVG